MRSTLLLLFTFCTVALSAQVFISEIHYDNAGTDTDEFIEITGPAGTDVSDYTLVLYNGNNGEVYETLNFPASTIIADQQSGFGSVVIFEAGIQNGPDAIALVDGDGTVIEFLSYEGTFLAVGGPADGMTSTDIGVSENGSTPVGFSVAYDGTWNDPATATPGTINPGLAAALPVALTALTAERMGKTAIVKWATATESGNSHFVVERSQDGRVFAEVGRVSGAGDSNGALRYDFVDPAPAAGDNFYRLRQVDLTGESAVFGPVLVSFAFTGLTAYPNPVGDRLYLSGAAAAARTTILDLNGRAISVGNTAEGGLATDRLAPGTYLLRVESAEGTETLRFVKR